jgi:hypothetical protein
MSRLGEALLRLERAMARLEAAAAGDRGGDETARRLAAAEAENARLRAAAGDIAARVDGALARVGRALGEGE